MINEDKLLALKEYFLEGGSTEPEDVAAQLITKKQSVVDEYVEALKQRFPEDFPGAEVDEEIEYEYKLREDTGLLVKLELVKQKGNKLIFAKMIPKDLVEIVVGGKRQVVDLLELRQDPAKNAKLIAAAELAKG